jgi:hypothetical protein
LDELATEATGTNRQHEITIVCLIIATNFQKATMKATPSFEKEQKKKLNLEESKMQNMRVLIDWLIVTRIQFLHILSASSSPSKVQASSIRIQKSFNQSIKIKIKKMHIT